MKPGKRNLQGVTVPIITPLRPDGGIETDALRRLVRRCVDAGAAAIFAGGSAGTGPLLRDAQWEEMLEIVREECGDKSRAMAGIIATSTARALDQVAVSRKVGYDTIVVTPTYYIRLERPAEILAHYEAIHEATEQDLVIYNIPSCTGCHIPVSVMETLVNRGWAVAIKESSGDADYFRELIPIARKANVDLLQGNEADIVWSLQEGAAGIVPVCANYDPEMFVQVCRDNEAGTLTPDSQLKINELREALLVGEHNWIAGITWGLKTLGYGSGVPPLPIQMVDAGRRAIIEALLPM